MHFSIRDLEDGQFVTLEDLLIRLTDPETSPDDKEAIAAHVRRLYPVGEKVSEYVYVACHAEKVNEAAASFAMRVLYVYGCKFPEESEPIGWFVAAMGANRRPMKLRIQAFMHLLLLNVVAAETAARLHLPHMVPLAATERCYPTFRRDDADSAYEQAMLEKLFH